MAMERENKAPRAGAPANRKRRKVCQFCVDKCEYIDYKDAAKLRRFISERSKILPRSDHRHLCHASASADRGDQARPSDRSAALRHRITANEKETRGACLFFCPEQALRGEKSALAAAGRTAQLRRASVLRSKSLAKRRFICPGCFNTGGWSRRRRRRNPKRKASQGDAFLFGASSGIRTPDTLLKRQVLCRLS